jgi:hypothetical protein
VLGLVLAAALAIGVVAALVIVNAPDAGIVAGAVSRPLG